MKSHFSGLSIKELDDAQNVLLHRSNEWPFVAAVGPVLGPAVITRRLCKRSLPDTPVLSKIMLANLFLTVVLLEACFKEAPRLDRLAMACRP